MSPQCNSLYQIDGFIYTIIANWEGKKIVYLRRFPAGLSHFVYDVLLEDQSACVIRIALPARKSELEAGLFWHRKLERIGVPLPAIYHTGEVDGHPFAVYERLPGTDLEIAYPSLTSGEKRDVARTVAEIQ